MDRTPFWWAWGGRWPCAVVAAWVALLALSPGPAGQVLHTAAGQAPAAESRPPNVETLLAEARRLIAGGQPGQAIARLDDARARRDDPRVEALLGVARYHADDYREAVATLEAVFGRLGDDAGTRREVAQVLGLALHAMGRYADAIPWLERARAAGHESLEQSQVLAVAYVQVRQPNEARAVVARIFAVDPDSAAAHLFTAQLMIRLQHHDDALAMLEEAVTHDPALPRAHFLLGQLALFRGDLEGAVDWTKRELAINPSDALAYAQLGDAYAQQEDWEAAIAALQRSIWINPYYSAPFILLGRAYLRLDQPAAAEAMLRHALEHDPHNRQARYQLARVLQQLGRTDEAQEQFEMLKALPSRR